MLMANDCLGLEKELTCFGSWVLCTHTLFKPNNNLLNSSLFVQAVRNSCTHLCASIHASLTDNHQMFLLCNIFPNALMILLGSPVKSTCENECCVAVLEFKSCRY